MKINYEQIGEFITKKKNSMMKKIPLKKIQMNSKEMKFDCCEL